MKTFTLVILILKNVQRPKRQPLENGNLMTAPPPLFFAKTLFVLK